MLNIGVMSLLGFFFWVVVARFYTETEVGFSSAIISAIGLLASLSLLGLDVSLIRFLPQTERPQELINTCFTLGGITGLVTAAIFLAGLNLWSPALSFITQNAIFTSVFIAFTLVWILSQLTDSTFLAKRRAEYTLSKNAIFSLLKIPLPVCFVLFFHTFGIVASWAIASGIALAVSLFMFLPRVQSLYKPVPTLNLTRFKHMWRYSGGSYLANSFLEAPLLLLPLMVLNLLGAESNAYFYVAKMMAGALFTIPMAVSYSLFAEGSHFEDKLKENVVRSLKFTALLLVPAVLLFVFAGKWLLLLFGESYSVNTLRLLQILAISSLPLAINHIYSTILRVTNRIRELVIIWGLVTIAVLIASYLIMPLSGIIGIGYAWLGAQSVLAIYILARRASMA
jgi:O-antigen/teichoic acid export membrane protein